MGPFVLRRLKTDVLEHLPPKTELIELVKMPHQQEVAYLATMNLLVTQARAKMALWEAQGASFASSAEGSWMGGDAKWVLNAFTELRKAAYHPLLLQRQYSAEHIHKIASELFSDNFYGTDASFEKIVEELHSSSDLDLLIHCRAYPRLKEYCLDSSVLLGSAKAQFLANFLPKHIAEGHRVLIFSQWTRHALVFGVSWDSFLPPGG